MGRPYTMKEMKQIVEYLIEHRAYGEVRGRRMWMDMANARVIDRTWQSLKETFNKRILPDIHNPYYKLSVEQMSSFRQMNDVTGKTKNKLVIRDASDDSHASENHRPKEQVIKKEDEKSGEGKCSNIQNRTRASTETLILETCSEVSSDNQKDVEPSDGHKTKSLRDLITYSEPLTPMLQEVIEDFTSDDDLPLHIVEDPRSSPSQDKLNKPNSPPTIRESNSYTKTTQPATDAGESNKTQSSKIKSLKLKKTQKGTWENKEPVNSSPAKEKETNNNESEEPTPSGKNSTIDTQLPNNQEGLAVHTQPARFSTESSTSDFVDSDMRKNKKEKRKRSRSLSSGERKKNKKDNHRHSDKFQDQTKDTQTFNSHPQAANLSKNLANELETTNNESGDRTNTSDDTNIPPNMTAEKTNEGTSQEAGPSGLNNPENPCLKPASLFAEQFSQSKYSDSENGEPANNTSTQNKDDEVEKSNDNQEKSDNNQEKASKNQEKASNIQVKASNNQEKASNNQEESNDNHENFQKSDAINQDTSGRTDTHGNNDTIASWSKHPEEIVLLKSHSDSDSEDELPTKITLVGKTRERALASVFGFSCGAVPKRNNFKVGRTNSHRYRNRRRSRNRSNAVLLGSASSDDYTTASESEVQRHHRGRKRLNSITRKYVEPKSFDIAQNPTDNRVYVMGRNKIYPILLKNGETMHYGRLRSDCNKCNLAEPSKDTFWKEKYLEESKKLAEEKIRADELARLLRQANERQRLLDAEPSSPILQHNVSVNTTVAAQKQAQPPAPAAAKRECNPEEMIKIKFTKNKEIELEGQWSHVTPVLEKMVAMFNNAETHAEINKNTEKESVAEPETAKATETNKPETTAQKTNDNPQNPTTENLPQSSKSVQIAAKENNSMKLNAKSKPIQRRLSLKNGRKTSTDDTISSDQSNAADVISSGKSTPTPVIVVSQADPEVRDKVDKIENEIFKAIEEIDKSDLTADQNGDTGDHVTKRKRGRAKKISSSRSSASVESLPKKTRKRSVSQSGNRESIEAEKPAESKEDDSVQKNSKEDSAEESKDENVRKSVEENSDQISSEVVVNRVPRKVVGRSKVRTSVEESDSSGNRVSHTRRRYGSDSGIVAKRIPRTRSKVSLHKDSLDLDDDSVRFMLPPPKGRKPTNRNYAHQLTIPSPDSSIISESTQGYQESDPSPLKVTVRKKRKLGTIGLSNKRQSNVRRKSSPYLADDDSCSNEALSQKSGENSTVNSDVYKSESYQLLMSKAKLVVRMERIDESPVQNVTGTTNNFENFTPLTVEVNNEFYVRPDEPRNELLLRSSEGNSSNFSLPLSPELSVVENLTVSREIIGSSPEHPFINEIQTNDSAQTTNCNKYFISEVDVSMPLMQQDCDIHSKKTRDSRCTATVTAHERMSINAAEPTDDSLEKKLGDLLLESAKKLAEGNMHQPSQNNMDVDATVKKNKPKRRSSTPRKRTSLRQLKTPNIDPVLEEHTESCCHSGRKSCPPIINIVPCEEEAVTDNNNTIKDKAPKGRKKKDVIRVKVGRPRRKSSADKLSNRVSMCTDSGINDTESIASECKECCDDSTELIHNHSDTCLHMDDCITDSVVFIDNANSIISLTSSLPADTESNGQESKRTSEGFVTPESFCSNAQDAMKFNNASKPTSTQSTDTDATTVYDTPPGNNSFDSLMTDDLSDEVPAPPTQSTKWYLFNEDGTNSVDTTSQNNSDLSSIGSNLRQIFPLTCAVPDLSTITEMSNGNDTKTTLVSPDSQMDTFSQTIFELQF